jgi:hypothetical protein
MCGHARVVQFYVDGWLMDFMAGVWKYPLGSSVFLWGKVYLFSEMSLRNWY